MVRSAYKLDIPQPEETKLTGDSELWAKWGRTEKALEEKLSKFFKIEKHFSYNGSSGDSATVSRDAHVYDIGIVFRLGNPTVSEPAAVHVTVEHEDLPSLRRLKHLREMEQIITSALA